MPAIPIDTLLILSIEQLTVVQQGPGASPETQSALSALHHALSMLRLANS